MDSQFNSNSACGNYSIDYELIKIMTNYCLNVMRRRTVDEQLRDFSKIINTPLTLRITYRRTELEVRYEIGSVNATVNGLNESKCVNECKQKILHNLKVICKYTNKETFQLAQNKDLYSDIELYKKIIREPVKNESNDIVLMDLKMDQVESFTSLNERIRDLWEMAKTPLILNINYYETEIEMTYKVGSHSASVRCPIESTCMNTCKIQLLQILRVLVGNHNDFFDEKNAHQEFLVPISSYPKKNIEKYELNNDEVHINIPKESLIGVDHMDISEDVDIISSSDKLDITVNDNVEISYKRIISANNAILEENPDLPDQPSRWSQIISLNESLITESMDKQNHLPCLNMVQNSPNEEQRVTNGSSVVMMVDQCSKGSKIITEKEHDPTNRDTRLGSGMRDTIDETPNRTKVSAGSPPKPVASADINFDDLEEHEMFVQKALAVLKTVTDHALSECADTLLNVLVHAHRADRSYVGLITDSIVKTAVREPTSSGLYAGLCSETVVRASVVPGLDFICDAFRDEMKMSCKSALSDLPRTNGPATTTAPQAYSLSKKVRVRTLETCRFIGRLFMLDRFKMSHTVKSTVNSLIRSGDAHCLECLCDLLHIIGPRFEMVDKVSRRCSAEKVYKELEEYAVNGTLPPQTVRRINRIIRQRNINWLPQKPSSP